MVTERQAIRDFLEQQRDTHPAPELLEYYLTWGADLETQINALPGGYNRRIPARANSEPEYQDRKQSWSLERSLDRLGSTGWLWTEQRSVWVGFDFDAEDHGEGLTDHKLSEVDTALERLAYVENRRSTAGRGRHVYVRLSIGEVRNHTEHAALARHVLEIMSADAGFNFAECVDKVGGVLWLWARDMVPDSFRLMKAATAPFPVERLPADWREREFRAAKLGKVERGECELEAEHERVLDAYAATGFALFYNPDLGLHLVHTGGLKQVHASGAVKGPFETLSPATNPNKPNAYMFARPGGGFWVAVFGGTEARTWETSNGKTWCLFNEAPSAAVACRLAGGVRAKKGWQLDAVQVRRLVEVLAVECPALPDGKLLAVERHGELWLEARKATSDPVPEGWAEESPRRIALLLKGAERPSHKVHYVVAPMSATGGPGTKEVGWWITRANGREQLGRKEHATRHLMARGFDLKQAELEVAKLEERPMLLVNEPFQAPYLDGGRFNPYAARCVPDIPGPHPTFDRVYAHVGRDLDSAVRDFVFPGGQRFADYGVTDGAGFLRLWSARLVRVPKIKLPYLGFYGPPDSGKSSFGDANRLLFVAHGVASGSSALNEKFNGALVGAVLVLVEEEDCSGPAASSRLKKYVTEPLLEVRQMCTDTYYAENTTHWCQFANSAAYIPVFDADARIVVVEVPSIPVADQIPRPVLLSRLRDEAPAFMHTLMGLELPPEFGKTGLPPLTTASKQRLAAYNSPVEAFIAEHVRPAAGKWVFKSSVFQRFADMAEHDMTQTKFYRTFNLATGNKYCRQERHKDTSGRMAEVYSGMELIA